MDRELRGVSGGQRAQASSGQRTQRGEWRTENTEGWVVDREHRGVSSGQRTQRGRCWTQDTEGWVVDREHG